MNIPNEEQLQLFSTPEPPLNSSFCDWEIDQEGYENSIGISGQEPTENEASQLQINDNINTKCSDTWISLAESEASALQPNNWEGYEQLNLWRSTPMLKQSCDCEASRRHRNSQEYQFTQTSETTTQNLESLKLLPQDFRVPAHPTQELERDSNIQLHLFGERDLDALSKLNPASVLSNNLKELSNEDFELFLADSLWQDTLGKLAMCRQQSLARVIKGSGCLSFPTLTSNASTTSRPAGQTKCEKWFKDNGLIKNGYQLGTQAIALTMGFPSSWFEGLTEQYWNKTSTQSQGASRRLASRPPRGDDLRGCAAPLAELEPGIWQEEPLHQDKQQLPSAESSTSTVLLGGEDNSPLSTESSSSVNKEISIPCLVKQPKQPEVKGVIRKDEGDRFLVDVDGEEISISKLFVYPDFGKSVGQIPPTKKATPPSKSEGASPWVSRGACVARSPARNRRKKGDGTGYIYRRTVTRKGKQYQEFYYRYRDESGKLKAKYIPQRLLSKVEEAESTKKPIADILVLLGGDEISRGEQSSTSNKVPVQTSQTPEKTDELISISRGEQPTPPSTKRRKQGDGTGYIECKPIKRSGKEYKQYWYHYEEWREGDRVNKKSRYIPKRLVAKVQTMEADKAPVKMILEVLIGKDKKNKSRLRGD